jgi:hypothetical protein
MPTRKQRRRRQKALRHEWEYVYVDDDGQEVEVERAEAGTPAPAKQAARPARVPGKPGRTGDRARGGRKIEPPSWRRVGRRAAIFAPVMLVIVYLLRPKDASAASVIVQVAVLLAFFLPFSYLMDSMMYRSYRKRIGDPLPSRQRKRG